MAPEAPANAGQRIDILLVVLGTALGLLVVLAVVASFAGSPSPGSFSPPGAFSSSGRSGAISGNVPGGLDFNATTIAAIEAGSLDVPDTTTGGTTIDASSAYLFENFVNVINDSKYGDVLADIAGRPFYVYDGDTDKGSSCGADCMSVWVPYLFPSAILPSKNNVKLGVVNRTLGTGLGLPGFPAEQLTINGRPVWLFMGQVENSQNVVSAHGADGKWWALGTNGNPLPK
jgi:predicted lipoprotein with Yx(FWY)xxD motif